MGLFQGYGRTRWAQAARAYILPRYGDPGTEATTARSAFYAVKRMVLLEAVAGGKDPARVKVPSWSAWNGLLGRIEAEAGPLEDAKVFKEGRGFVLAAGQELPAHGPDLARVEEAAALVVVESAGVARLLGDRLKGTGAYVVCSKGIPSKAVVEAVRKFTASGRPAALLSDSDPGGEIIHRTFQAAGVRRIGLKDVEGFARSQNIPFDYRGLVIPDVGKWRDLRKTLGPERLAAYQALARAGGLKDGAVGKVEVDAVAATVGTGGLVRLIGSTLDEEFPRAKVERARPPGPSTVDLLMARMAELTRALERHRAARAKRPAPAPSSWLAPADPLEVAARGLLRQADGLLRALRESERPGSGT